MSGARAGCVLLVLGFIAGWLFAQLSFEPQPETDPPVTLPPLVSNPLYETPRSDLPNRTPTWPAATTDDLPPSVATPQDPPTETPSEAFDGVPTAAADAGAWQVPHAAESIGAAEVGESASFDDDLIRRQIIERSLSAYGGSCPCPYNTDRAGRSCGARSAWSRPGGASPICYPSDISDADVQRFRGSR